MANILFKDPKLNQSYRSKYSDTINVTWLEDICELPRKESVHFFLANEFFDALPIQKFQVNFELNKFYLLNKYKKKKLKKKRKPQKAIKKYWLILMEKMID